MSDLTGQSILNNICFGGCGDERRTTVSAKRLRVLEQAQKTGNLMEYASLPDIISIPLWESVVGWIKAR
jgi:hypothetical protein